MTETKWTPGDWEIQGEDAFADMPFIRIGVGDRTICEVLPPVDADEIDDETRANANLTVAAPALYAALDFVKFIEEKGYDEKNAYVDLEDDDECICLTFRQFREIMLARRKARGE